VLFLIVADRTRSELSVLPELRMAERLMRTDSKMIDIININDRPTIQNNARHNHARRVNYENEGATGR